MNKKFLLRPPTIEDKIGLKFHRWTVLGFSHRENKPKGASYLWVCQCECGNVRSHTLSTLQRGDSKSCGCLTKDRAKELHTKHGHGSNRSQEYVAWQHLSQRCNNPKDKNYFRYGARGITICERWQSFENFLADMGLKPSRKHSLDRIDNSEGYSPENCRWATFAEQMRNTRRNFNIEYQGKTYCVGDLAKLIGMNHETLRHRIKNKGMSVEDAINTPVRILQKQMED